MDIIWTFETANVEVVLGVEPEEMDPAVSFDDVEDIEAIRRGEVEWFCATVEVRDRETGEVLGRDHLGGCAYTTPFTFREDNFGAAREIRRLHHTFRNQLEWIRRLRATGDPWRQLPRELDRLSETRRELSRMLAYERERRESGRRGGDYFGDMVREACSEARRTLARHAAIKVRAA